MDAYSQDVRDRVLRARERGDRPTAMANRFAGSRVWVYQVRNRLTQTGPRVSLQIGGHWRSRLVGMEPTLRAWLKDAGDLTLAERCARLAEHGIMIQAPALWHQLDTWQRTCKNPPACQRASTRDVSGRHSHPPWYVRKLVFLDETGASTPMARRYGRAPRVARCIASVPHGHWHTTTFVTRLHHDDSTAPMGADGTMTGALFLQEVRACLCPTLHPGDIVIADNVRSHTVAGVKEAVEAVGAHLRSLPPYSPDLNPIEKLFAKLTARLRNAAPRTVDALWQEIGTLLDRFTPDEGTRYFASSGYVQT